mgnify:CR=1 FL=1
MLARTLSRRESDYGELGLCEAEQAIIKARECSAKAVESFFADSLAYFRRASLQHRLDETLTIAQMFDVRLFTELDVIRDKLKSDYRKLLNDGRYCQEKARQYINRKYSSLLFDIQRQVQDAEKDMREAARKAGKPDDYECIRPFKVDEESLINLHL